MLDLKRTILSFSFNVLTVNGNHKNVLCMFGIQCISGYAKINLNGEYFANLCVVV